MIYTINNRYAVIIVSIIVFSVGLFSIIISEGYDARIEEEYWEKLSGSIPIGDYFTWSHDSKKIAFHDQPDLGIISIYVVTISNQSVVQVAGYQNSSHVPVWSSDDSKICYWMNEIKGSRWGEEGPNLHIMDSDGSNDLRLTNHYTVRLQCFSGDDDKIFFFSCYDNLNGWFHLYSMDPDGSNCTMVADHGTGFYLSPSPHGGVVAYEQRPGYNKAGSLYLIDENGSNDRKIYDSKVTGTTDQHLIMTWSPEGNRLLFADGEGSDREIMSIGKDGKDLIRLTNNEAKEEISVAEGAQIWNPINNKIFYSSKISGNWDIWIMDPDGSNQTQVTFNNSDEVNPLWSPDGTRIAFISNREGINEIHSVIYDRDNDGVGDPMDIDPDDPDIGDRIDTDQDGIFDDSDIFPEDPNEWNDTDQDGIGDNSDVFPTDPAFSKDQDGDGYPDALNPGKDQSDSILSLKVDDFPEDPNEWNDTDQDGIGDNTDVFPTDPAFSMDQDGDGYPDALNPGKNLSDSSLDLSVDIFPEDPFEWSDTDGDDVGDHGDKFPTDHAASLDIDGDGYPDEWNPGKGESDSTTGLHLDAFPYDFYEQMDTDGDGIGDNSDSFPTDPAASKDSDLDGWPEEWNDNRTEKDSTTGLKLDEYPDDFTRWKREDEGEMNIGCCLAVAISLLIFIIVMVVLITLTIIKKRKTTAEPVDSDEGENDL